MNIPDRIYWQYRNKPKAVSWYNITSDIAGEFADCYDAICTSYNIDTAGTAELDVIGRIVVLDRGFMSTILFDTDNWGSSTSQFGGSGVQFKSLSGMLDDNISNDLYRILLKAKIVKNNGDASVDNIIEALSYVLSFDKITINDNEDMSFDVTIYSTLLSVQRFALNTFDVIPKPQGVRFNGFIEQPSVTFWGGSYNWGAQSAQFGQYFGV